MELTFCTMPRPATLSSRKTHQNFRNLEERWPSARFWSAPVPWRFAKPLSSALAVRRRNPKRQGTGALQNLAVGQGAGQARAAGLPLAESRIVATMLAGAGSHENGALENAGPAFFKLR